jgi:hydroxymethylglutaryl-CoA lyase
VDNSQIYLTECPRDAMQGISAFIPTELKVNYLNALLDCGFDRLDFGSFVSPKAIPQLQDTASVLSELNPSNTDLLAIIANERGMDHALEFERISYLGYPFSVSEQFQQRNTNASIKESKQRLKHIASQVHASNRTLMLYLSMGFGNPYGDPWSVDLVVDYAKELYEDFGITNFALSDTIGSASPELIKELFNRVSMALPTLEVGVHLHTNPNRATALIEAALATGCTRFDVAMLGIGGCPMAKDELTGNLATETIFDVCVQQGIANGIDSQAFQKANRLATTIFNTYH